MKSLGKIVVFILTSCLLVAASGCQKFNDPGIDREEYTPDSTLFRDNNKRHLLFISIDGLPAEALQSIAAPTMVSLLPHAKFSWDVRNVPVTNAASWASMMTGNDTLIHRIWDESFYAKPIDSTSSIPVSPNLTAFRLIYSASPEMKLAAASSWPNLVNTLLRDADTKVVTESDLQTKDEAKKILNTDVDVLVVQFGSVIRAGIDYGFSSTTAEYKAAVMQCDDYVKELLTVMKSRPGYAKEEWLTMITTTQGGSGLMADRFAAKPGFLIVYNPLFKTQDLVKMNPSIRVLKEDMTPQILYWMKVPQTNAVQSGQLWIDRFGVEFIK